MLQGIGNAKRYSRSAVGYLILSISFLFLIVLACGGGGGDGGGTGGGGGGGSVDPSNYTLEYAHLQYLNYESVANNRVQGAVGILDDGVWIEESDMIDISLSNAAGPVSPYADGFYSNYRFSYDCTTGPCTASDPRMDSGFYGHFSDLAQGTYNIAVEMENGQILTKSVYYPGQLLLPYVSSSSMVSQWNTSNLSLSWVNPSSQMHWNQVNRLVIVLFDDLGNAVLSVQVPPHDTGVVIPATLLGQAATLQGGTAIREWEVQTRAHDVNNMNYARGYSNKLAIQTPTQIPSIYTIESSYLQNRTFENPEDDRVNLKIEIKKNGAGMEQGDIRTVYMEDSLGRHWEPHPDGGGYFRDDYYVMNCYSNPCTVRGPIVDTKLFRWFYGLPQSNYNIRIEMENGQTLYENIYYPGELKLPYVDSSSMTSQWTAGGDLIFNWANPTHHPNWSKVKWITIHIFNDVEIPNWNMNNISLIVSLPITTNSITIPADMVSQAKSLRGGTALTKWQVLTNTSDANNMNYARGFSNAVTLQQRFPDDNQTIEHGYWDVYAPEFYLYPKHIVYFKQQTGANIEGLDRFGNTFSGTIQGNGVTLNFPDYVYGGVISGQSITGTIISGRGIGSAMRFEKSTFHFNSFIPGEYLSGPSPLFSWTTAHNADSYRIRITEDNIYGNCVETSTCYTIWTVYPFSGRQIIFNNDFSARKPLQSGVLYLATISAFRSGVEIDRIPDIRFKAKFQVDSWSHISAGSAHSLGIKTDGTLWAWGFNGEGCLGDGTTNIRCLPVQVGRDSNWAHVSAGSEHSLGIKTDGTLWAWGSNWEGCLGDGTNMSRFSPVRIGYDSNWTYVSAGVRYSLGIKANGTLWGWGGNTAGTIGDGTTTNRLSPVQIGYDTNWSYVIAGMMHSLGIKADGSLWAWGDNKLGCLGDESLTLELSPMRIGREANWSHVAVGRFHSLGIKTDGSLWAWGNNGFGQIGDTTTNSRYTPLRIGSETNWAYVESGPLANTSIGIKRDGSLWAWGANQHGVFGDGTTMNGLFPGMVGSDLNWATVSICNFFTLGVKADRSLWAWGLNAFCELGLGEEHIGGVRYVPTRVAVHY